LRTKLAFYKGKGTWVDKLIRWWTSSPYSHVELVVGDQWYSTSPRDNGVRSKVIVPKEENWDYLEVEVDTDWLTKVFDKTKGQKYDWWNIFFTQIVPLEIERSDKWICSEWCGYVLTRQKCKLNPEQLYDAIKYHLY